MKSNVDGNADEAQLPLTSRAEAIIHARTLRVTTIDLTRAYLTELFPQPHKLKKWAQCYLIFETILSLYLLICLVAIYSDRAKTDPYLHYRNASILFVFCCILPFMACRVISLLCCKAVASARWIWGTGLLNFIMFSVWALYAIIKLIMFSVDGTNDLRQQYCLNFMNEIILILAFGPSIPVVIIGIPYATIRIAKTVKRDKDRLSRKVAQIKLLPRTRYMRNVHTAMSFCTICMARFKNAHSHITYLPCDPRHFFHSKCIESWLLGKNEGCPLCQVHVDYVKSIEVDQSKDYATLCNERQGSQQLSIESAFQSQRSLI